MSIKMIIYHLYYEDRSNKHYFNKAEVKLIGRRIIHSITPKTWKRIGGGEREHGRYEEGIVQLFKRKDGSYVASSYYDGCFYPIAYKIKSIDGYDLRKG